ncbi:bleomycin resistance family protein [Phycisphaerales bacterium AB-hyl4]|uniref:Bleomycin resistance family protein n=1 Tax=Natronomicrosphaera hydrolytica TaxID=3242702 RepID=A0ABV4U2S1_9BACT
MVDFQFVTPILRVQDLSASVDYYVDKLGFEKKWTWGDPATFGCVARGEIEIFLCQGSQGQPGMWMSIFVDDVDTLHAQYQASGAMIRQAPINCPWGTREMNVEDIDGHRLRMSGESTGEPDGVPLRED